MGAVADARAQLAGKIAAGGTVVTMDPRALPPCVLLGAPEFVRTVGVGGWLINYPVHVIAAPPGNADALDWMLDTVEAVIAAAGFAPFTPGTYGDTSNPAYTGTYPTDVTNPAC